MSCGFFVCNSQMPIVRATILLFYELSLLLVRRILRKIVGLLSVFLKSSGIEKKKTTTTNKKKLSVMRKVVSLL